MPTNRHQLTMGDGGERMKKSHRLYEKTQPVTNRLHVEAQGHYDRLGVKCALKKHKSRAKPGFGGVNQEGSGHEHGNEGQQKNQDSTGHGENHGHVRNDGFHHVLRVFVRMVGGSVSHVVLRSLRGYRRTSLCLKLPWILGQGRCV